MDFDDTVAALADPVPHVIEAAAGCGKTELIVRSVERSLGRQLVLTHTHAGVRSLRSRFRRYRIPSDRYVVATIDGFVTRYAGAFPRTCGPAANATFLEPSAPLNYPRLEEEVALLIQNDFIRRTLKESYTGVFIDEYQDCTQTQHNLVLSLNDVLPCRLLGDPLQAIFDFTGNVVNWETQVMQSFSSLPAVLEPKRWSSTNPSLGVWLSRIRENISSDHEVNLSSNLPPGVVRLPFSVPDVISACQRRRSSLLNESLVVIHPGFATPAHDFAKRLGGSFLSADEMELKDLVSFAKNIDDGDRYEKVAAVVTLTGSCLTGISNIVNSILHQMELKSFEVSRRTRNNLRILNSVQTFLRSGNRFDLLQILILLQQGQRITREIWYDLREVLRAYSDPPFDSMVTIVQRRIEMRRHFGSSRESAKLVSRILLVKGLEYDHTILHNATRFRTMRELYVALSRARTGLTIFSENPIVALPLSSSEMSIRTRGGLKRTDQTGNLFG